MWSHCRLPPPTPSPFPVLCACTNVWPLLGLSYVTWANTHLPAGKFRLSSFIRIASTLLQNCDDKIHTCYLVSLHPWTCRKRNDSILKSSSILNFHPLQKRISLVWPWSDEYYLTPCPQSRICSQQNLLAGTTPAPMVQCALWQRGHGHGCSTFFHSVISSPGAIPLAFQIRQTCR